MNRLRRELLQNRAKAQAKRLAYAKLRAKGRTNYLR
jgi:hypothetical protein